MNIAVPDWGIFPPLTMTFPSILEPCGYICLSVRDIYTASANVQPTHYAFKQSHVLSPDCKIDHKK